MRLLSLINRRGELRPSQSTTAIVAAAARRHGASWVAGIDDISLNADGDVLFRATRVERGDDTSSEDAMRVLDERAPVRVAGKDLDALFVRTNPGRDMARSALHEAALNLCRIAESRGIRVLNDPDALPRASDKLYLAYLPPRVRPRMILSRDTQVLREFVEAENGPTVLKPLYGTQGRGVFRVRPGGPNLNALIEVLVSDGFVIAQEYLRRAPEGDTRVILVDGRPLEVDGRVCAVRRVPGGKEFRSNVHLGGQAKPAEPSRALIRSAIEIGEKLAEHGIWMAGVDIVGTKAVEVNVRSPGGLVDAGVFEGVDFIGATLDSIESSLGGR